ncbi:MAG: TerB family tellurite resistance protein [Reichenbachiella sp.]
MEFRDQLKSLIQLSLVDNNLSNFEKRSIYALGIAHDVSEREIDDLFHELLSQRVHELPKEIPLTEEGKLDYLYNIIILMKADKKVYLSEIKFCEELAMILGFKKSIIKALSGRIFSDPNISSSIEELQDLLEKYKLEA